MSDDVKRQEFVKIFLKNFLIETHWRVKYALISLSCSYEIWCIQLLWHSRNNNYLFDRENLLQHFLSSNICLHEACHIFDFEKYSSKLKLKIELLSIHSVSSTRDFMYFHWIWVHGCRKYSRSMHFTVFFHSV